MKELLKAIRAHLGLSQAEFADLLNISFATVNRWENGRALPNKLAQSAIFDICKDRDIPLYDMILQKIKSHSDSIAHDGNSILLYHGSKSGVEGDIAPISRKQCDFGPGFYMGTDPGQALTLICDYECSKFYIVSIDVSELSSYKVPANIEWAMLVAYHRGKMANISGTAFYDKYRNMLDGMDLVIGSIADDRMFYVLDNFFIGNITDAALVHSLSALQLGKQFVAISEKACRSVKLEAEIELSYLERLCIKYVADHNRIKGVVLANSICKDYRREGLYFDEILDTLKGPEQ